MDADGASVVRLTEGLRAAEVLPGGSRIAFNSSRDGDFEIFVMDADGSNVRQLTNNSFFDAIPSWSPDGTNIVFQSDRDGDSEVFVMDADGSNVRQLTHNNHGIHRSGRGRRVGPFRPPARRVRSATKDGALMAESATPIRKLLRRQPRRDSHSRLSRRH